MTEQPKEPCDGWVQEVEDYANTLPHSFMRRVAEIGKKTLVFFLEAESRAHGYETRVDDNS